MNYENQEWEISLKDLFFSVLNQWKKLLVTAVILAVALGGFQGYRAWRGANNPETLAQYQEEYETELEAYEQEREALERSIEDLEQIIESQNKYMEESALMQMDYHNIYEASVSLYFTTDYQIMPQMFYQDVDNTKTIVALYKTALESNGIIDAVAQEVGMETKYLNELVTITKDSDYVLQISVIHDDKDTATEIMELILASLHLTTMTECGFSNVFHSVADCDGCNLVVSVKDFCSDLRNAIRNDYIATCTNILGQYTILDDKITCITHMHFLPLFRHEGDVIFFCVSFCIAAYLCVDRKIRTLIKCPSADFGYTCWDSDHF